MVTTSDLEKLNVINERTEKDVHYHGNFIPHSISWMLPPDRIDHHEQNSLVTKLRNKRLHYLLKAKTMMMYRIIMRKRMIKSMI